MTARMKILARYGAPVLFLIAAQGILPLGLDLIAAVAAGGFAARGGYLLGRL